MIASLASADVIWQDWLSPHVLNKRAESTFVLPEGHLSGHRWKPGPTQKTTMPVLHLLTGASTGAPANPGNGKLQIVIWAIHHVIQQECSSSGSSSGAPHSDHLSG